jgi:hypothetical protein
LEKGHVLCGKSARSLKDTKRKGTPIDRVYFLRRSPETETAAILGVAQQAVGKQKRRIIAKLRNNLIDWVQLQHNSSAISIIINKERNHVDISHDFPFYFCLTC